MESEDRGGEDVPPTQDIEKSNDDGEATGSLQADDPEVGKSTGGGRPGPRRAGRRNRRRAPDRARGCDAGAGAIEQELTLRGQARLEPRGSARRQPHPQVAHGDLEVTV